MTAVKRYLAFSVMLASMLVIASTAAAGRGDAGTAWRLAKIDSVAPDAFLRDVDAVPGRRRAWAVGESSTLSGKAPPSIHFRGRRFALVPMAEPTDVDQFISLAGVDAVADDDVWAVGWYRSASLQHTQPLIEHYDGSRWRIVPAPGAPQGSDVELTAVSFAGAQEGWAIGEEAAQGQVVQGEVFYHYSDGKWVDATGEIPTLDQQTSTELLDIDAEAPDDILISGTGEFDTGQTSAVHGVIYRWDGQSWHEKVRNDPRTLESRLPGVDQRGGEAWAVGDLRTPRGGFALAMHRTRQAGAWRDLGRRHRLRPRHPAIIREVAALRRNVAYAAGGTLVDPREETDDPLIWRLTRRGGRVQRIVIPNASPSGSGYTLTAIAISGRWGWAVGGNLD
jgi:hypothetical protein